MSFKNMPKVSVIISTFNRENYVCEAIESVLSQTYPDYEIIVVDDGSTDNTKDVLEKYGDKVRYFYQENKGLSGAKNLGISKSRGEYIAFLDDDDLWLPDKLSIQVSILDADSKIAFISSDTYVIDSKGTIIKLWKRSRHSSESFESLYEANFAFTLTVIVRKKCLDSVGIFDENLKISQDYDLWLRLAKKYKFKHLDMPLAKYRVHPDRISRNIDTRLENHIYISNKPEICKNVSFIRKKNRHARDYYLFAKEYYAVNNFTKAGICYLKAVLNFPFIGYYYYPHETENFRFSMPYRILKVYFLPIFCFAKNIRCANVVIRAKRVIFKFIVIGSGLFSAIRFLTKNLFTRNDKTKIGLLNIEFFHKEVGGFGGYGKSAKNITDHFNSNGSLLNFEIIITRHLRMPEIKNLHNTDVLIAPDSEASNITDIINYSRMLNSRNYNLILTLEYCTDYQYSLFLLARVPLIIWIHDPRPLECLEKIATSPLEVLASGKVDPEGIKLHGRYIRESMKQVIMMSKLFNRKIIFTATCYSLIERAKKLYNLPKIEPSILPTPIEMPRLDRITFSAKPSFCFLGRLDPIKRPWIYFELAKKFPDVDFFVAGKSHFPGIMSPIINKYLAIPNLKFLGMIDGREKDDILRNIWAIVNTSIHEALPVSFLESFSYGKPIISCQNPDNLVGKFGEYTGEILGDGFGPDAIGAFEDALTKFLKNGEERIEKGMAARKFVEENYSFQQFEQAIRKILTK